jgi:hypothetical protein
VTHTLSRSLLSIFGPLVGRGEEGKRRQGRIDRIVTLLEHYQDVLPGLV